MPKMALTLSKTKLPDSVVSGDSFVVTRKGKTYHPHAGESVTFRGEPTWAETQRSLRLQYLAKLGSEMMSVKEAEEMLGMADVIVNDLTQHIKEWTWTGQDDSPFPSVPSAADLLELPGRELIWLFGAYASISDEE